MLRKLIPVVGDVRVGNIGIKPEIAEEISEEVDVIINSAANTTFDERFLILLSSTQKVLFAFVRPASSYRFIEIAKFVGTM